VSEIESDFGTQEYCSRCLEDIRVEDFRDKNERDVFRIWGFCSECQQILTREEYE